jgi:GNAT superfamily N-acetyltransferase
MCDDKIYELVDTGLDNIQLIEKLWLKNAEYHNTSSKYFSTDIQEGIFQKRLESWQHSENLKFTIAKEDETIIGYCISSAQKKIGVIESLYVDEKYRKQGIGKALVTIHIKWFESLKCKKYSVTTVYENPIAISFYKAVGLFPKKIVMESIE